MFSEGGKHRARPGSHLEATGLGTAGRVPVQVAQPGPEPGSALVQDPRRPSQSTSKLSRGN
ncbi:hypothetical protein EYF80_043186 [Liparis tanakae]|uniref:Uncharacterized protein n=1 Tax=Liparis tanakae TaxID=230148 RepID=A0A4Z2FZB7_9TELE|nr:hypothetical protein EYF80_043186 [Liparis tanakae]